jgi:hypothetical protein
MPCTRPAFYRILNPDYRANSTTVSSCWLMSRPYSSWSSDTRSGEIKLVNLKTNQEPTPV